MLTYTIVPTRWGFSGLVYSGAGLCGLLLPESTEAAVHRWLRLAWPQAIPDERRDLAMRIQLQAYFDGEPVLVFRCGLDLSRLTRFGRAALEACRTIEYGHTATYGELARWIGLPRAARAVGAALARNPVPLAVPCHRVIASDGSLCGFSSSCGVDMKRRLLEMEAEALKSGKGAESNR